MVASMLGKLREILLTQYMGSILIALLGLAGGSRSGHRANRILVCPTTIIAGP